MLLLVASNFTSRLILAGITLGWQLLKSKFIRLSVRIFTSCHIELGSASSQIFLAILVSNLMWTCFWRFFLLLFFQYLCRDPEWIINWTKVLDIAHMIDKLLLRRLACVLLRISLLLFQVLTFSSSVILTEFLLLSFSKTRQSLLRLSSCFILIMVMGKRGWVRVPAEVVASMIDHRLHGNLWSLITWVLCVKLLGWQSHGNVRCQHMLSLLDHEIELAFVGARLTTFESEHLIESLLI